MTVTVSVTQRMDNDGERLDCRRVELKTATGKTTVDRADMDRLENKTKKRITIFSDQVKGG